MIYEERYSKVSQVFSIDASMDLRNQMLEKTSILG
jgi:hypothetical protein